MEHTANSSNRFFLIKKRKLTIKAAFANKSNWGIIIAGNTSKLEKQYIYLL
tara:strand:+ start:361 stop:513 length:153 start_codon:yes stop_codon:yes gene_type:complete